MGTSASSKLMRERIESDFTYHAPTTEKIKRHEAVRDAGHAMAIAIISHCPESRELSLALTKIEEAVMWANAAIARND